MHTLSGFTLRCEQSSGQEIVFKTAMRLLLFFIILYQQMHFNISYNVCILYGTLPHVLAPWCYPQGALRSLLKLHTIIIFTKYDG